MDGREKRLRKIRELEEALTFAPPAKAAKITAVLTKLKATAFSRQK